MSTRPVEYRRLPGASYGGAGRARLWLGGDHLLEVGSWIAAERYRRFPLADIRALVIEPTRIAFIWTVVSGSLLLLALLAIGGAAWGTTRVTDKEAVVALWAFVGMAGFVAVFLVVILIVNLVRGPSCRCTLQTGAGPRVLAAPTRRRTADRVCQQLAAEIETAQASLLK